MKKVFTLVLAMTIVVAGFAQVKSARPDMKQMKTAQKVTLTGMEERDYANFPSSSRSIVEADDVVELAYTTYDWQSNMGPRNFTAVWPDGYAVMCYTLATDASYSDRGTGLAIWDPAVGEWEYTETRVEGVKTGFGAVARYKENGLVLAAHTASDLRIFIVEDFREGNRDFGTGIVVPNVNSAGVTHDPCWPAVQCSGDNLDIIHILATEYSLEEPYKEAILYSRYEDGEFTVRCEIIEPLDENHLSEGGSNTTTFLLYNPETPNRVSFIMANAWGDGKVVISEDNGQTWGERVYYQHPGYDQTFEYAFLYPRWVSAQYDVDDNLHIAYEYNGSTGEPGSGSYYPGIGGIGYWSEVLPKNEMCLGGIGEVGGPFIMDSTYISQDLYESEWYWSDANHDPLPEYIGEMQIIDGDGNVVPWDSETYPEVYHWIRSSDNTSITEHGSYNSGPAAFASMYIDGRRIFVFWSMLAGSDQLYFDGDNSQHYFRLFSNMSLDGGRTWEGPKQVLTDIMFMFDESVYGQLIPYVYEDEGGEYLWYCYQADQNTGTFVQNDDSNADDNHYSAAKVYIATLVGVEENGVEAPATSINVYPNPAQGAFFFELNNEADVNIFNAVGQLVKTYNNVKSVEVRDLEAGIYFVKAGNQTSVWNLLP